MRTNIKMQLMELLGTMQMVHNEMWQSEEHGIRQECLQLCQEGTGSLRDAFASQENFPDHIYEMLVVYEDCIRQLIDQEAILVDELEYIQGLMGSIEEEVEKIPSTYHVVFFPYNASMWDSLESIYLAAKEDPNCECYVVPIPYYQCDQEQGKWIPTYDGDLFPSDIPITHYQAYQIDKLLPDIAYIHNPYDDKNFVTRVDPKYYSSELKKYVKQLVYVPYFVTGGAREPQEHEYHLPVFQYADYIILQSENYKKFYKEQPYYHKLLSLGSPKLDKVIHTCAAGGTIPEEWKEIIGNKKVIMINTTINTILNWNEKVFDVLSEVFREVDSSKIAFIWRPHPLLESTLRAMRPHLIEQYQALLEEFQELGLGVIDQGSDLNNTIAISHGYLGCGGSSVVNLFRIVEKPICLLTYNPDPVSVAKSLEPFIWWANPRVFPIRYIEEVGERYYLTISRYNVLISVEKDFTNMRYEDCIPNQSVFQGGLNGTFAVEGDVVYLAPLQAEKAYAYHTSTKELQELFSGESIYGCKEVCIHGEEVFYLPAQIPSIYVYHKQTKKVTEYKECMEAFKSSNREWIGKGISRYVVVGDVIYMSYLEVNSILEFNMGTKEYQVHLIGSSGYIDMVLDGETLWLSRGNDGALVQWNRTTKEVMKEYTMPKKLRKWKAPTDLYAVSGFLFLVEEYLISMPAYSELMVRCHRQTGRVELLKSPFFGSKKEQVLERPCCAYAKELSEDKLLLQRGLDYQCVVYSVSQNSYQEIQLELADQALEQVKGNIAELLRTGSELLGRGIIQQWFTWQEFINLVATQEINTQESEEAMEKLGRNLDGTCGSAIHSYMMDKIREKLR